MTVVTPDNSESDSGEALMQDDVDDLPEIVKTLRIAAAELVNVLLTHHLNTTALRSCAPLALRHAHALLCLLARMRTERQ